MADAYCCTEDVLFVKEESVVNTGVDKQSTDVSPTELTIMATQGPTLTPLSVLPKI